LIALGFDPANITMHGYSGGGYWYYPPEHGWISPLLERVDPRSLVYSRVYRNWDIPALALK